MKKVHVYYDKEGDFLEVQIGKARPGYFEQVGIDTFVRKDERTGVVLGFALFNVQKVKALRELSIPLK